MADSTLEAVLRRDRLIVASALGVIAALAWAYVLWLAADMDMDGMNMSGLRMVPAGMGMMAPAAAPWSAVEFAFVFVMWAVMMVGMMAPSAAPMILLYARVGRQGKSAGKPFAATAWFAAGYFLAWAGFSLAATLVQWMLEREALLDARMTSANILVGAVILIAAGIYQWLPIKNTCLAQCQTPLRFLMSHGGFRSNVLGCLHLGLLHGIYCVGCCWVLMALLFVVGVMNVLWIALLALLVLLEKLTPWGRWIARIVGAVCIAAGAWMVFSPPHVRSPDARNEIRCIGCRSTSGPCTDQEMNWHSTHDDGANNLAAIAAGFSTDSSGLHPHYRMVNASAAGRGSNERPRGLTHLNLEFDPDCDSSRTSASAVPQAVSVCEPRSLPCVPG